MNSYLRMAAFAVAALLVLLLPTQNARATVVHTGEVWRVGFDGPKGTIIDYFVVGLGDTLPGDPWPRADGFSAEWEGPIRKDFCPWCGETGPDTSWVILGIAHGGFFGDGFGTAFIGDTNHNGDYHLIYMTIFNIVGDADIHMNGDWGKVAVPLPATLPLFATGLGVLGLFGWRRKRRA